MDLFNNAGSGITRYKANEDGSFYQSSFISNERVEQALADLGFSVNGEGNGGPISFPAGGFPRFDKLLQQIKSYVGGSSNILHYLSYYSGFSKEEIMSQLEYGKGVAIFGEYLKNAFGQTPYDKSGIYINLKYINGLEIAKLNETIQGTSFLLTATILHELVHYGRLINGMDKAYEYGEGFERDTFGEVINKYNAINLYRQNGWYFNY